MVTTHTLEIDGYGDGWSSTIEVGDGVGYGDIYGLFNGDGFGYYFMYKDGSQDSGHLEPSGEIDYFLNDPSDW